MNLGNEPGHVGIEWVGGTTSSEMGPDASASRAAGVALPSGDATQALFVSLVSQTNSIVKSGNRIPQR